MYSKIHLQHSLRFIFTRIFHPYDVFSRVPVSPCFSKSTETLQMSKNLIAIEKANYLLSSNPPIDGYYVLEAVRLGKKSSTRKYPCTLKL